jgi:hypothetical protein
MPIFQVTSGLPKVIKIFFTLTVMSFFNILGLIARVLLPRNSDLFLDQVVLAVNKN